MGNLHANMIFLVFEGASVLLYLLQLPVHETLGAGLLGSRTSGVTEALVAWRSPELSSAGLRAMVRKIEDPSFI